MEIVNELEVALKGRFFWTMVPVKSLFDLTDATEIVFHLPQALILSVVFNPQTTSCSPSHH